MLAPRDATAKPICRTLAHSLGALDLSRHKLPRWTRILALTTLAACRSVHPEPRSSQQPPPSPPPLPSLASSQSPLTLATGLATQEAPPPGPEGSKASSEGGPGTTSESATIPALDESTADRKTFRQVVVGAIVFPPKRLTWTLFRSLPVDPARIGTAVYLRVLCQEGKKQGGFGISLNGKENQEAAWSAPTRTDYTGAVVRDSPLTYRLSSSAGVSERTACAAFPTVLQLECHPEQISVLAAGAALIPGKKMTDERMSPAHWQPSRRERISALRCDIASESEPATRPSPQVLREWPLMFAAAKGSAPGVEWAYANADMVVQEGDYRWMPAAP